MSKVRVAVPSIGEGGIDGERSGHFGHCGVFTIFDIEDNVITKVSTIPNVEHQEGGCDYTIGCGTRTYVIEAESMDDALSKYVAETEESYREADGTIYSNPWMGGEYQPNSAKIYEIASQDDIDFEVLAMKVELEIERCRQKDVEDEERRELERLQAKYNK